MKKEWLQKDEKEQVDAGLLINIVSHQLKRRVLSSSKEDFGLTGMQHRVLHYILVKSQETEVYQKDVEKEFDIRKSTATEMLQLMERKGFLYRECSSRDARMKKILITEKAAAVQREVAENIRVVEARLRNGIEEKDFQICMEVLKKMAENLSADEGSQRLF